MVSGVQASPQAHHYWQRAIILVDMNAFFASVEQRDFPELKGQPVAITNGHQGSCIITCSYEARAYGLYTGIRLPAARKLCPHLIVQPSRPSAYCQASKAIMQLLQSITPDVEVFSVDEAFMDLTHCQRLHGTPIRIAHMIHQRLRDEIDLPASIGLSGDKTTAKYAAKFKKPNGLTIIPPWQAAQRLSSVPVTDLCGIGPGISRFLAKHGVLTCGDMQRIPMQVLAKRFGNWGKRLWWMCQGVDPSPVIPYQAVHKSMGHSKILPPGTTSKQTILAYFCHLCDKLAARLRRHQLFAQHFFIGWRDPEHQLHGEKIHLLASCHDSKILMAQCRQQLAQHWQGGAISQVFITALDPHVMQQPSLWEQPRPEGIHTAVDAINARFGSHTIQPARLSQPINRTQVIPPSWKESSNS